MNINWNADKYAKDFAYVHRYGEGVMELLDFNSITSVLDLGCGTGALTQRLAEKGAEVVGIDASPEQLAVAKAQYPGINFICADATNFTLAQPVDAVFSNAVLHWIDSAKQPDVLQCVSRALKPGGQFILEMGGHGNNKLIHAALAKAFAACGYGYTMPFYFPSIGEYTPLLESAGFEVKYATLFDRFTELTGSDGLKDWLYLFVKIPFAGIGDAEKDAIINETVDDLRSDLFKNGKWYADYVRLRIKAIKVG